MSGDRDRRRRVSVSASSLQDTGDGMFGSVEETEARETPRERFARYDGILCPTTEDKFARADVLIELGDRVPAMQALDSISLDLKGEQDAVVVLQWRSRVEELLRKWLDRCHVPSHPDMPFGFYTHQALDRGTYGIVYKNCLEKAKGDSPERRNKVQTAFAQIPKKQLAQCFNALAIALASEQKEAQIAMRYIDISLGYNPYEADVLLNKAKLLSLERRNWDLLLETVAHSMKLAHPFPHIAAYVWKGEVLRQQGTTLGAMANWMSAYLLSSLSNDIYKNYIVQLLVETLPSEQELLRKLPFQLPPTFRINERFDRVHNGLFDSLDYFGFDFQDQEDIQLNYIMEHMSLRTLEGYEQLWDLILHYINISSELDLSNVKTQVKHEIIMTYLAIFYQLFERYDQSSDIYYQIIQTPPRLAAQRQKCLFHFCDLLLDPGYHSINPDAYSSVTTVVDNIVQLNNDFPIELAPTHLSRLLLLATVNTVLFQRTGDQDFAKLGMALIEVALNIRPDRPDSQFLAAKLKLCLAVGTGTYAELQRDFLLNQHLDIPIAVLACENSMSLGLYKAARDYIEPSIEANESRIQDQDSRPRFLIHPALLLTYAKAFDIKDPTNGPIKDTGPDMMVFIRRRDFSTAYLADFISVDPRNCEVRFRLLKNHLRDGDVEQLSKLTQDCIEGAHTMRQRYIYWATWTLYEVMKCVMDDSLVHDALCCVEWTEVIELIDELVVQFLERVKAR